jgi:ABC-type transport system involved in cytochrome bd biosynthesis fused ATPase/permease subunit
MDATIKIDGLHKRFGETQALDGMTFTVRPGQVIGFIGPNGAGKSTTMRVVLGLDAPDAGTATIGGRPYLSLRNPLCHVGSLLDAGALQPGRSGRNHLLWLAHSQGLKASRVDEVIALTGLQAAAAVVSNPTIARHLDQIGPLPAGLDAQATTGINSLPLTPWQGLGVIALWTAGAVLVGALALRFRDA